MKDVQSHSLPDHRLSQSPQMGPGSGPLPIGGLEDRAHSLAHLRAGPMLGLGLYGSAEIYESLSPMDSGTNMTIPDTTTVT